MLMAGVTIKLNIDIDIWISGILFLLPFYKAFKEIKCSDAFSKKIKFAVI